MAPWATEETFAFRLVWAGRMYAGLGEPAICGVDIGKQRALKPRPQMVISDQTVSTFAGTAPRRLSPSLNSQFPHFHFRSPAADLIRKFRIHRCSQTAAMLLDLRSIVWLAREFFQCR